MTIRLKTFVSARIKRTREEMALRQLDAFIVTDPADVTYLTGFTGDDSIFILSRTRKILVTDSRYTLQARQQCYRLPLYIRKNSMDQALATALSRLFGRKASRPGKTTIAIQAQSVTLAQYRTYRRTIGKNLKQISPLLPSLRQCKDKYEITQIRKSVRITENAINKTLTYLKPSVTENEIAARLEYEMACRGSSAPAFPTIVAFGSHAAQPHAQPGKARLKPHQPILFDCGATYHNYTSDLTRCYIAGKIPPAFAEAYQWVLQAQLTAIKAVRPGTPMAEIDAAAKKVLQRSHLPLYGHGTGHGIGLNVHELPVLSSAGKDLLQPGMVVTIEPGLYLPGRFGIRIEDDVLVTEKSAAVLSKLPKDLNAVTLG